MVAFGSSVLTRCSLNEAYVRTRLTSSAKTNCDTLQGLALHLLGPRGPEGGILGPFGAPGAPEEGDLGPFGPQGPIPAQGPGPGADSGPFGPQGPSPGADSGPFGPQGPAAAAATWPSSHLFDPKPKSEDGPRILGAETWE